MVTLLAINGKDFFLKLYKDPTEMSADYEDFKKNQKIMIILLANSATLNLTRISLSI
jgi:hypothetical protein